MNNNEGEFVTASEYLRQGEAILSDRGKTYDKDDGQQERSMEKTVEMFALLTGIRLTERQGWEFMAVLKQVRSYSRPDFHEDSYQDRINYTALAAEAGSMEAARAIAARNRKTVWEQNLQKIAQAQQHALEVEQDSLGVRIGACLMPSAMQPPEPNY